MSDLPLEGTLRALQVGGNVAVGNEVSVDNTGLTGVISNSNTVQNALSRLDATGLGSQIIEFTGSFAATVFNKAIWSNSKQTVYMEGARGQRNARRTFTLPNIESLNSMFDDLVSRGVGEVFTITIGYLGGNTQNISRNSLTINTPSVSALFDRNEIPTTLAQGRSATFRITREGAVVGQWQRVSVQESASSQDVFGDVILQTRTWSNANNSFLPSGSEVQKGYAFRVVNSAPNDGSLRQGLVDAGVTGKIIYDGDLVVWVADAFTAWTNGDDWIVIPADDVRRITAVGSNFLSNITEFDNNIDTRAETDGASDALVWLTNTDINGGILSTAPFIDASSDISRNPSGGPFAYIGGRELQNSDGDFVTNAPFGNPRSNSLMYLGITASYILTHGINDIYIQIYDLDSSSIISELNLNSNFVKPSFGDGQFAYFVYSQDKISDAFTQIRYLGNQEIRIIRRTKDRHFSLNPTAIDLTQNIQELPETRLSQAVQAKLNKETSFSTLDRARLNGIEVDSTSTSIPTSLTYMIKYGAISHLQSDYHPTSNSVMFIGDFDAQPIVLVVPNIVEVTHLSWSRGSIPVSEIRPSLFDNTRTYTATIPAFSGSFGQTPLDYPISIVGTAFPTEASGLTPTVKIDDDNLPNAMRDAIYHNEYTLPSSLEALANQARVFNFDNVDFTSNYNHAGISTMYAYLKNEPNGVDGSTTYPIQSSDFVNEITNSEVTATPPSDLFSVYIPRLVSGQLDNGVDVFTNGALTGAGIVNNSFIVNTGDSANHRIVFGLWFDKPDSTTNTGLFRIKNNADTSFHQILNITNNQLVARRLASAGGTSTRTVDHSLYTTSGGITFTFSGAAIASEGIWRVYEARTYTINARLIANGNDEGSTTLSYTISNINTSQGDVSHTLSFGNGHTQEIRVSYAANTTLYGGPGHTLRVGIDELADNQNFDIDHILMSVTYETTETVTTSPVYEDVLLSRGRILPGKLHKVLGVIETSDGTIGGDVRLKLTFGGYNAGGNFTVYDENLVSLDFPASDLDFSQLRFGGNNCVIQNIQGLSLNTDTPPSQFPTHPQLRDWMLHYDNKERDYVWDNATAPQRDIQAVYFPENVNFDNFVQVSPDGSRWRMSVTDAGATTWTKIV